MPNKHVIEFVETPSPITEPVTKFGGQPNWITFPQWPLSEETGNPMRFIGQITLSQIPSLMTSAKMAYLFMTDEEDGEYVDGTWEPDSGENAIVLQPGNYEFATEPLAEGPTLYRMVERPGFDRLQQEACEFGVSLHSAEDVEYFTEEQRWKLPDDEVNVTKGVLEENKIGGTPVFLQGDEMPFEDEWQFLMQVDSATVPFYSNFGDAGIGYAFMNADGTEAKFLWQCA